MRRYVIMCVSLGCLAGCGTGADDSSRDATAVEAWSVDPVPAVDIAGTTPDGELAFNQAAAATRLSNGVIVVADVHGDAVRFFDASGRAVRTFGRAGEGPGEFGMPLWIGQCAADTVFVWDPMLARVTVIDSTGRYVRQYPVQADLGFLACSRSGVVAGFTQPDMGMMSAGPHFSSPLRLADSRGEVTASLGDVPYAENRPLGKVTRLAMSDERLYVGTSDSAWVDVYTLDGQRTGALPIGIAGRPPTQPEYERAIDDLTAAFPAGDYREQVKGMLLEIPMPETLSPYGELFADPDGTLWALIPSPADSLTQLRAVGEDGRVLADLLLPANLTVFEVGHDYILGAYAEEDGDQHIALYRLHR